MRHRTKRMKYKILIIGQAVSTILGIAGLILGAGAGNAETFAVAIIMMAIGFSGTVVLSEIMDSMKPEQSQKSIRQKIEEMDEKAIKSGQFNYIYDPGYSFVQYLRDHGSSLKEYIYLSDESENPAQLFRDTYEDYVKASKGRKVQSKDIVQSTIWRERRRME